MSMSAKASPPQRLATAQTLAQGYRRPVLHPSLQRVQQRLSKTYINAEISYGHGLTDAGLARKLMEVFTKLMLLPRADLRSEFDGVSFASSTEERRRMQHVLNAGMTESGTTRYVELAELFREPIASDAATVADAAAGEVEPAANRCPGSGSVPMRGIAVDHNEMSGEVDKVRSVRVLLIASAGCGKTTLMTKYCPMQWARGELWSKKFDLVLAREFRYEETRRIGGVKDLLGGWDRLGVESSEDRQQIVDFVLDNPHRVCLVLDGLDETKLASCSEYLQKVIRGEELCGIHLVLTSRATEDVFGLSESCLFDLRVELIGFLPSDVPEYVERVLGTVQAEKLLAEVKKNPYLGGVMCTPYFAASVCDLYKWRSQAPRCLSDVFELMVLRVAERRTGKSYEKWASVREDVQKQILDLGYFAFRMLAVQRLVFYDKDLSRLSLGDDAVGLGLLVACERDAESLQRQWRFAHLSLQEGLSAMFVANCGQMHPAQVVRLVHGLGPLSGHLETFWQLLGAQLNPQCMDCLVNALLLRHHCKSAENVIDSLLCGQGSFPLGLVEELLGRFTQDSLDRLAEKLLNGKVSGSGRLAVENEMKCSGQSSNTTFLMALRDLWRRYCPEATVSVLLDRIREIDKSAADACSEAVGLGLQVCLPMKRILDGSFLNRVCLVHRCCVEYLQHVGDDGARDVCFASLRAHLQMNGIAVSSRMSVMDVFAVEYLIKQFAGSIGRVSLQLHRSPDHLRRIVLLLQRCDNVTELHASFPPWEPDPCNDLFVVLLNVIRRCGIHLVELDLQQGGMVDDCLADLVTALGECRKLKVLKVSLTLTAASVNQLAPAIDAMTDLESLHLPVRSPGENSVVEVLPLLTTKTSLRQLKVVHWKITGKRLSWVTAALSRFPNLEHLTLMSTFASTLSDEDCGAFIAAIHGCICLQSLQIAPTYAFINNRQLLKRLSYPSHLDVQLG